MTPFVDDPFAIRCKKILTFDFRDIIIIIKSKIALLVSGCLMEFCVSSPRHLPLDSVSL